MKPETLELLKLIISLASLFITTVGAVLIAWIGMKQTKRDTAIAVQGETMIKLEQQTNSIKDALVASTAKASHLEGKEAGKAEQKAIDSQTAADVKEALRTPVPTKPA